LLETVCVETKRYLYALQYQTLRKRVAQVKNIIMLDGHTVISLVPTDEGTRVAGVEVRKKGSDSESNFVINAELFVDATGKSGAV
jgi:hypothetical protein